MPLEISTTWSISAFISGQPSTSILLNLIPKSSPAGLKVIVVSTPVCRPTPVHEVSVAIVLWYLT